MSRLPAALGWTGVALILAPLAVLCVVFLFLLAPWLGVFAAVFALAALVDAVKKRRSPPPPAPPLFDIRTAAVDWAAPRRSIEIVDEATGYGNRRQMRITVAGWTFSVVWGFGTYSTAGRSTELGEPDTPGASPDAEVAVWQGAGGMIELAEHDSVEGWVPPSSLAAALEAVERGGDARAIRSKLHRAEV